ncbi:adenylate kinase [Enorma sp.]|uniref:adenylate kinase n=1 Tax=Enorma sp. TaxID=1920692 RepID=UPI003AB1400D
MFQPHTAQRILVVGCPGAGRSTFARKLHDALDLPLVYLDMLWHKPDQTTATREEFDVELDAVLRQNRWIIDGNYARTLKRRLERAETVFLFDLSAEECLAGAAARIGHPREDLPWIERKLDAEFAEYIRRFPTDQLPQLLATLDTRPHDTSLVTFRSREEADAYITALDDTSKQRDVCHS